jgi:hypothetical protein
MERLVHRALAKRPEDRFQSADDFRQALDSAAATRDDGSDISGFEKTMVAVAPGAASGPRWMRVAMVMLATAMGAVVIADHHLPASMLHQGRGRESSATDNSTLRSNRTDPISATAPYSRGAALSSNAAGAHTVIEQLKPKPSQSQALIKRSKQRKR